MQTLPYLSSPACVHPAAERVETRRATLNGKRMTLHLCAYGWSTRTSWGHSAYCPELNLSARVRYYNRTWEAHRFDSVISCLWDKVLDTDAKHRAEKNREERAYREWRKGRAEWEKRTGKAWGTWPREENWEPFFKAWKRKHPARKPRA